MAKLYDAVSKRACQVCGEKLGSNRARCPVCWDAFADWSLSAEADRCLAVAKQLNAPERAAKWLAILYRNNGTFPWPY